MQVYYQGFYDFILKTYLFKFNSSKNHKPKIEL